LQAIQDNLDQAKSSPIIKLQCLNSPQLITSNDKLYLTVDYLDTCYIGLLKKEKFLKILIEHADLTGLEILIFSNDKLFASSIEKKTEDKLVQIYKKGQKKRVTDRIYHLLPAGNMPKMVRWTKSSFIYDLPKQSSVSYQLAGLDH